MRMTDSTVVFDLDLTVPSERREWSYLELVQNYMLKHEATPDDLDHSTDPEVAEKKKLTEIAKALERKYGTMVTMTKSGKRKRVRLDDFLDPGEGYDTQDSFIDDSEAVDVFVAPNVSTKHGGFYVFEGTLEGLEDQDAKIEAPCIKQPKPSVIPPQVAKKNKSKQLLEKAVKCLSAPKQNPAQPRSKMQNLDSVFDSVLRNDVDKGTNSTPQTEEVKPSMPAKVETQKNSKKSNTESKNESAEAQAKPIPPLPTALPAEICNCIATLVGLAAPTENTRRGFSRQFQAELLNLASMMNTSNLNQHTRSTVFAHVEGVLHLKRKTLTRRLKKLHEACEDQKLNQLLDELSDAIARTMPALLESYVRDKEAHTERLKVWQADNADAAEGSPCVNDGTTSKRVPKPGAPKKIFRWNDECRVLYQSVITARMENYQALNIKGPREEYLRSLFPTLTQLWPDGWISNAALWRAALPVFHQFCSASSSTGNAPKPTSTPPVRPSLAKLSTPTEALSNGVSSASPNLYPGSPVVVATSVRTAGALQLGSIDCPYRLDSQSKASPSFSSAVRCSTPVSHQLSLVSSTQHAQQSSPIMPIKRNHPDPEAYAVDGRVKQNVRNSAPAVLPHGSTVKTLARPKLTDTVGSKNVSLATTTVVVSPGVRAMGCTNTMQATAGYPCGPSSVSAGTLRMPSNGSIPGSSKPQLLTATLADPRAHGMHLLASSQRAPEPHGFHNIIPGAQAQFRQPTHPTESRNLSGRNTDPRMLTPGPTHSKPTSNIIYCQPFEVKLTANHVDQLQQRAISSSVSSGLAINGTAPNSSVVLQRPPPPAHQHLGPRQPHRPLLKDQYSNIRVPVAHLGSCTLPSVLSTPPVRNNEDREPP